jgi:DNA polymerase IIIc chi subunit
MNSCIFHDTEHIRRERKLFEIVENGYSRQEKVLVFAASETRANELDRILWILKQEAFIPHKICRMHEPDPAIPVAIVIEEINPIEAGVLIADGHCSIEFACAFDSVHEFVDRASQEIQQACRERYRRYRERDAPVQYLRE